MTATSRSQPRQRNRELLIVDCCAECGWGHRSVPGAVATGWPDCGFADLGLRIDRDAEFRSAFRNLQSCRPSAYADGTDLPVAPEAVSTINDQPSTINNQPSIINHQPSTINNQQSTINHQQPHLSIHPPKRFPGFDIQVRTGLRRSRPFARPGSRT